MKPNDNDGLVNSNDGYKRIIALKASMDVLKTE